jgi:DNA-binding beta-propeller fold protein YncE
VADPASGRVAVGLRDPDRLAVIDGRRGRVLERLPLPESPRHLALGPDGDVLVPAERANRLVRVSLPDGRRAADVAVGAFPHDATVAGDLVFVGDERGNTVTVLDGRRRVDSFPVATQPGGLAALADGRRVAVVSVRERVVELYDVETRRRLARVPAGVGPTHVVSEPRFDRLYVTDTSAGALLVFDTRPELELVRRVYLPGAPYGIALDEQRHRLWVTLTGTNEVVELPAHGRPHVLRRFPTARQPDTVAVDAATGRVFITGRHAGVVQLLDP